MSTPLYYGHFYEPQAVWSKLLDEDLDTIGEIVTEVLQRELERREKRAILPRRFILHSDEEGKQWFCTLYPNGYVHINISPSHYKDIFPSFEEFRQVHTNRIEWID